MLNLIQIYYSDIYFIIIEWRPLEERYDTVDTIFQILRSLSIMTWLNIIHLLHAGEGNMKSYSPKSIIFPEGNARGEYDTRGVNQFSYFLNLHAINVLLYRIKPRKHIHVKYCWQAYFKSIGTLSQTFKYHIHNKWCVPSASDGKTREASEGVEYDFYFTEYRIWFLSCVLTCSDFYPLSNQINLFMVINIRGIIIRNICVTMTMAMFRLW